MNNINVFSGPMKCGKSQKILDEANAYVAQFGKLAVQKRKDEIK